MKKSLLALAVVAVAASANAATVYDKDGTSLGIDGRVQSVFYSGNHDTAGENDSSIQNSARFGLAGKTQITDWVAGIGYAQWDMDEDGSSDTTARDQYVGADFGEFGVLKAGRFVDSSYYAEEVTDHYEDAAGTVQGRYNGERRGGQLMYTYDNYGFHGQFGVQTAQDNARVLGGNKYAVDSGFNGALGYTFDDVVFGPLTFRAGYSYLKGQTGNDIVVDGDDNNGDVFDSFKHATAGVAWGNLNSGFYAAALYDYAKMTYQNDGFFKSKGFELAAGYAFDNGVSVLVGYESVKNSGDAGVKYEVKAKRVPVFVNYKLNSNFNVWAEAGFNAGSDHEADFAKIGAYSKKLDKTVFSVGARYTF